MQPAAARTARDAHLDRIRSGEMWDLVVIGGGATGLGAAVDAAARGYRVALVEAADFAQGTSSRSTKLVHGGVRYLAGGQIGLVREALHERGVLLRNAPHLVHPLPFLVPARRWWETPYYALGLGAYDLLAGRMGLKRSRPVGRRQALRIIPTLRADGLHGGVLYADGQFDDARLAITLLRTLDDLGGTAVNHAPLVELIREQGRIRGVVARDEETGESLRLRARVVINATGVFADSLRRLDEPGAARMIRPSRGIHLVLPRRFLPTGWAIMVPKTDDGRVLFAIPWHDRVLLGTTDTPTDATPLEPRAAPEEIAFLLEHAARYLDPAPTAADVLCVFAGLRPLIDPGSARATARISREHAVLVSDSGLVTITGGKWTTYRRMGADVVDRAAAVGGLDPRPCATESLHLHGWVAEPETGPLRVHGSDAPEVASLCESNPAWSGLLHPALPYRVGEVVWAARHEWALSVEDVLSRRLRALILDARAAREAAPTVATLLAHELGRDDAWRERQVEAFAELVAGSLPE